MTAVRTREVEAARTILAVIADADGDWQPHHHDAVEAAAVQLEALVARWDRDEAQRARAKVLHPAGAKLRPSRGTETPIAARRAVEARSRGFCEVDTDACPAGPHVADHVHHRDRNRKNNDPENLLHVCTLGHGFIHDHPEESFAQGWMTRRNGAVVQPLYLRGQQ